MYKAMLQDRQERTTQDQEDFHYTISRIDTVASYTTNHKQQEQPNLLWKRQP